VVAAVRQRRVNAKIFETEKPPGKTGRFFIQVEDGDPGTSPIFARRAVR
jgi:hypothetical protein